MFVHNTVVEQTKLCEPALHWPVSAGIICFSIAPTTGDVYMLLGLEDKQEMWCDYGGAINPAESIEGAAAREFCEESICAIKLNEDDEYDFMTYEQSLKRSLLAKDYVARIDILHKTVNDVDQVKVYFLKRVPWQPEVKVKFRTMRQQIVDLTIENHPAIDVANKMVKDHWLEKRKLKYWSLVRLKDALKNHGRFKSHKFRRTFLSALAIAHSHLSSFLDAKTRRV